MLEHEFFDQISRVESVFGKQFVAHERTGIIWRYACDLETYKFRKICDHFITTFKTGPLPQDFIQAIRLEKRFNEESKKAEAEEKNEFKISCKECLDTGMVRALYHDNSFSTLMRCHLCENADLHDDIIPKWDNRISGVYKKSQVPAEFFNPEIDKFDSDKAIEGKIYNKMRQWGAKISVAKDYWRRETEKMRNEPK